MWLLLLASCRVVEPPPGAPVASVTPIPVRLPSPEPIEEPEEFTILDALGLPLDPQATAVRWQVGERTVLRRFLPGTGRWRRSLLPVDVGADADFHARVVRAEEGALEEDLDQLRYRRILSGEGVRETLSVERVPVPIEKLAHVRRQRGPLVPPPYAAMLAPGTLPARAGEQELSLKESAAVKVLYVGGPSTGDHALVDLSGRRFLVTRDRIFALPAHAMLAMTPSDEAGDTTLAVVVTQILGGEATVLSEQGSQKLPLSALVPVRVPGGELLGDLPGESWLWLSEDRPEGPRIYLEQPVRLRGIDLPAGLILELSAAGAVAAVQVEEAIFLGDRRFAPGTRLVLGDGCAVRESALALPDICLDVVNGRLIPR